MSVRDLSAEQGRPTIQRKCHRASKSAEGPVTDKFISIKTIVRRRIAPGQEPVTVIISSGEPGATVSEVMRRTLEDWDDILQQMMDPGHP